MYSINNECKTATAVFGCGETKKKKTKRPVEESNNVHICIICMLAEVGVALSVYNK